MQIVQIALPNAVVDAGRDYAEQSADCRADQTDVLELFLPDFFELEREKEVILLALILNF